MDEEPRRRLIVRGLRHGSLPVVAALAAAACGPSAPPAGAPVVVDLVTTSAAFHACAVMSDATARCWGANRDGQLGNGVTSDAPTPVPAPVVTASGAPLAGVTALATGRAHTCALLHDGGVDCWGVNDLGQLGDGGTTSSTVPVAVVTASGAPLTGIAAVAAGEDTTCAIVRVGGGVLCWGDNDEGALGSGDQGLARSTVPVAVVDAGRAPLAGATAISAGYSYACAVLDTGAVRCWGNNIYGQLGDGDLMPSPAAMPVGDPAGAPLAGAIAVSTGVFSACALVQDGGVHCWGLNTLGPSARGLLGANDTGTEFSTVPVTVVSTDGQAALAAAAGVSVGDLHACVRLRDGGTQCWGDNTNGQLGNDSALPSAVPVAVLTQSGVPLADADVVSAGSLTTCALLRTGAVTCWGDNFYGQLGGASVAGVDAKVAVTVDFP